MSLQLRIEPMIPEHWPAVAAIYQAGIDTRIATFRTAAPTWEAFDESHTGPGRLVAFRGNEIAGWAALSPAFDRGFYWGVVEDSVYIHPGHAGKGVGKALLEALLAEADAAGYWSVEARIIRANEGSLALHRACGFRDVGYREALGRMEDGPWHDVLFLERRSKVNGVD